MPIKQKGSKLLQCSDVSGSKQILMLGNGLWTDSQRAEPKRQSSDIIAHAMGEHSLLCLEQVVVLLP